MRWCNENGGYGYLRSRSGSRRQGYDLSGQRWAMKEGPAIPVLANAVWAGLNA